MAKPRHVACSDEVVRVVLTLLVLSAWPAWAEAQVTLVVRTTADAHPSVETAVENELRESLGGSVRRVGSPLDELALAAGCSDAEGATSAACIATIASAAGARLVAIERLVREGSGWRVSIDLRRADGTQVSVLGAVCDDASCAAEAEAEAHVDPDASAEDPPSGETRYGAAHSPLDDHRAPSATQPTTGSSHTTSEAPPSQPSGASRSIALIPHALFVGAAFVGIASIVAGGLSIAAADQASAMGTLRNPAQVDHERALEEQSSIALGVRIALATCGAGLAIAGLVTLGDDSGPRFHVGLGNAGLSVSF